MATKIEHFIVPEDGTESNGVDGAGHRLVGLNIPTLDSTAIAFEHSTDGGSTWRTVFDLDDTPAAVELGGADTGGKAIAVPDSVGRLSPVGQLRITVAQQSAQRVIEGLYERLRS